MDFLDDDDEDEVGEIEGEEERERDVEARAGTPVSSVLSLAFLALMRVRPALKASRIVDYEQPPRPLQKVGGAGLVWTEREVSLSRRVAVCLSPSLTTDCPALRAFLARLSAAKFSDVQVQVLDSERQRGRDGEGEGETDKETATDRQFDAIVLLCGSEDGVVSPSVSAVAAAERLLVAGGQLIALSGSSSLLNLLEDSRWVKEELFSQPVSGRGEQSVIMVRKRAALLNETAALYWTRNIERLRIEREWVEKVSVPVSVAERVAGVLCDASHAKAVDALVKYGVVIFPGMFDRSASLSWGESAKKDMQSVLKVLREKKHIDLLHPADEGDVVKIDNFHELSMREALRCDVRNVANLKAMHDALQYNSNEWPVYEKISDNSSFIENMKIRSRDPAKSPIRPDHNVRFHPAILSVLHQAMNPPGNHKGNWGRWNFEGPGPEAPIPFRAGRPGVIFSFPGCADQTIHADTPQLFVNQQLHPHYINLFVAASNAKEFITEVPIKEGQSVEDAKNDAQLLRGFQVGHTAFVAGSQDTKLTEKIMTQEGGQAELEARLIRPQLDVGDALLFDCRILHFGLANQSTLTSKKGEEDISEAWRLMLYVNYHHSWFHDPKNWNDQEKLFAELES